METTRRYVCILLLQMCLFNIIGTDPVSPKNVAADIKKFEGHIISNVDKCNLKIKIADTKYITRLDESLTTSEPSNLGSATSTSSYEAAGMPGRDGIKGVKGERGLKGEKGDLGERGMLGSDGPKGIPGTQGERGDAGSTGDKGDKGDPGERGEQGLPGIVGNVGARGEPGLEGPPGIKGERGDGIQGVEGPMGEKGHPGIPGINGRPGIDGLKGIKGEPGTKGERGADGTNGEKGEKGDPGERGVQGPMGEPGKQGAKGERGLEGSSGLKGDRGDSIKGIQGPKGERGDNGPQGIPGTPGSPGIKGDRGDVGPAGKDCTIRDELPGPEEDPDLLKKSCAEVEENGIFDINPRNPFSVNCNIKKGETCLFDVEATDLEVDELESLSTKFESTPFWVNLDFRKMYNMLESQMTYLLSQSTGVRQTFRYHCKNNEVVPTDKSKSMLFSLWNGQLLGPEPSRQTPMTYNVEENFCNESKDTWKSAVIKINTNFTNRLPVVDVFIQDIHIGEEQKFYLQLVELCFPYDNIKRKLTKGDK